MASKTYYIGDTNIIRVLDDINDIGAPPPAHVWVDISLPSSIYITEKPILYDIKTEPEDADKVFVVGRSTLLYSGIAVSGNAGSGWFVPNGDYILSVTPGFIWHEVWPISKNNIVVCGQNGIVALSTDQGQTFNTVTQVSGTPLISHDLYSIHFQENSVGDPLFGVVGLDGYIAKTIDGGNTWGIMNGGLALNPSIGEIDGIYLSEDYRVIIAVGHNGIARSVDGGNTFTSVHTFSQREGRHLTWLKNDTLVTEFWATGLNNTLLKSSDQGVTWTPVPAPTGGDYLAAHFYSSTDGFYGVNTPTGEQVYYTQPSGTSLSEPTVPNLVSAKNLNAVWTSIITPSCYLVTNCSTGYYYIVNTDLSAFVGQAITFTIPNNPTIITGCWSVQESEICSGSIGITLYDTYINCATCQANCYLLTNCSDPNDYLLTSTDLSTYLHKVVKLEDCDNRCYYISKSGLCDDAVPIAPLNPDNIYNDCVTCQGVATEDPIELNFRRIKPGFYTPNCPPEYVTKVNCKYANQVFDDMAAIRYGIKICCEHDAYQWLIKKQLLDLQSLYDSSLCVNTVPVCDEPCNVTAFLETYPSTMVTPPVPPVYDCLAPGPADPEVYFGIYIHT